MKPINRKWRLNLVVSGLSFVFFGCSENFKGGTLQFNVLQSVTGNQPENRCTYKIAPAPITTLSSVRDLKGSIGQVVFSNENVKSRPEILNEGVGFSPVDTNFSQSGSTYTALDYGSLAGASLYYAMETAYLLFKELDPSVDMNNLVSNLSDTKFVLDARRTFDEKGEAKEVRDNAEYFPRIIKQNDSRIIRNYFFVNPAEKVVDVPFALNLGIMVHEFSHFVFQYLFYEKATAQGLDFGNDSTFYTIASMDEGLADYFGFLAIQDPAFFLCTLPSQTSRVLSTPKTFTKDIIALLDSDKDVPIHGIGGIFAAIQYEIGEKLSAEGMNGHRENGKYLLGMMRNLSSCLNQSGSIKGTFGDISKCHMQAAGSRSGVMAEVYQSRLGDFSNGSK